MDNETVASKPSFKISGGRMQLSNFRLILNNGVAARFAASPNHGGALTEKVFIVIHYTGGTTLQSAVNWLVDRTSQVSSHLVVGRDGEVAQLVPFDTVAWHAGVSQWGKYTNLNAYSIGIELDNAGMLKKVGTQWVSTSGKVFPESEVLVAPHQAYPTVNYGWHKYSETQINDVAEITALLMKTYGFREIVGHDEIAPKRKWDPGPAFPMAQFRLQVAALLTADPKPDPQPDPKPEPDSTPIPIPSPNDQTGKTSMRYKVENLDNGQSAEYSWNTAFRPVVLLPVPYVSQLGEGANTHKNDCGATSAIMLLRAYLNLTMTPDEFYTKFSIAGDPYLSVTQLRNALGSLGLLTDFKATLTLQDLFAALAAGKPPIVLLRYKVLEEAGLTEKTFEGPHFAVVVGMDVKYIYVHDPLYTNPVNGAAHPYPLDIFWLAWKEVANDPSLPNPERSAILPTAGIGFSLVRKVKVNLGSLNVRSGPGATYQVVGVVQRNQVLEITNELAGWGKIGENRWVMLSYTVPAG